MLDVGSIATQMACSEVVGRVRMASVGGSSKPVKGRRRVTPLLQQLMAEHVLRMVTVPRGGVEVRQVKVKVLKVAVGVGGQT